MPEQMPTDHARIHAQKRRQVIMDSLWKQDAYAAIKSILGAKRVDDDWGGIQSIDIGVNLLKTHSFDRATLYLRPVRQVCLVGDTVDEDAGRRMHEMLRHYEVVMRYVQANTYGVNDYCLRYDVVLDADGVPLVRLHPTTPAYILHAVPRDDDPRQAQEVHEKQTLNGSEVRIVWTDTRKLVYNTHGELIADEAHEQGRCPWVLYHNHGMQQLWRPFEGEEQVEGTYNLCKVHSFQMHNLMEASWAQRAMRNMVPMGLDTQASADGTSSPVVHGDPTGVFLVRDIEGMEGQGQFHQWNPAVDPDTYGRAVARVQGRYQRAAGGQNVAVYRQSGNAESAYAMAITRESQREDQMAGKPLFQPSDAYMVDGIALAANTVTGVDLFPPSATWTVRYTSLPPSIDELQAIQLEAELGALQDWEVLVRIDPFMTEQEARARVAARTTREADPNG